MAKVTRKTSRKILYSPGFGAGWTTWEHEPKVKAIMLTWKPIVKALENGEGPLSDSHPAVVSMLDAIKAKGFDTPYLGGLRNLTVATITGKVLISEYDGNEGYQTQDDDLGWM